MGGVFFIRIGGWDDFFAAMARRLQRVPLRAYLVNAIPRI
jgi:hypothetical protein